MKPPWQRNYSNLEFLEQWAQADGQTTLGLLLNGVKDNHSLTRRRERVDRWNVWAWRDKVCAVIGYWWRRS